MELQALTAALAATPKTAKKADATERSQISRQQFLDLLVAELVNQDPMEPLKNDEFMNQLVQLQSLESTSALTDGIRSLVLQNQMASGSALLGKQVRGLDDAGDSVTGQVQRVLIADGQVRLLVAGRPVALGRVQEILPMEGAGVEAGTPVAATNRR
ncbi:MAG: hypothetical protein HY722_17270 [Planctomycetes bacterium]|nr:hypothetical protein [Planctomycetota bacterium]